MKNKIVVVRSCRWSFGESLPFKVVVKRLVYRARRIYLFFEIVAHRHWKQHRYAFGRYTAYGGLTGADRTRSRRIQTDRRFLVSDRRYSGVIQLNLFFWKTNFSGHQGKKYNRSKQPEPQTEGRRTIEGCTPSDEVSDEFIGVVE